MGGTETEHKIGILITQSADRRVLEEFLRSRSYEVIAPKSGDLDVDKFRDMNLVLADETAALLHQEDLLALKWQTGPAALPVLVAIPSTADSSPFLESGFDDVLRWPIRKAELLSRVALFLRLRQQSELQYQALFENAILGIYRMTPAGRFLLANPAMLRILQCNSIEEIQDQSAGRGAGPRDEERQALVENGCIKGHESIWKTCRGEERLVRENATAVRGEDGGIIYLEGTVEDLTDKQRGMTELAQSEERFRTVAENSIDIIAILAADGRINYISPAVNETLSKASASLIGTSVFDLFPEEAVPEARNEIMQLANDPDGGVSFTLPAVHEDGSERILAFSGKNLLNRPAIQGLLFNIRDVTERRRFEDDLIGARRKAEEMTVLKSNLLANMSHEIRTPLTGILGFTALLADEVGPEQRQYVDWIEKSGNRLLESLNSVLALAQLESKDIEPTERVVDVPAEVEDVVKSLSYPAARKGLYIETLFEERRIEAVMDPAFLGRIVTNILGNAIKFTDEGGIEVHVSATDDAVSIKIKDTGIGISRDFMPHVFEEFKQESAGLSRMHEGSGLGLAITKRLVEALEGEITVQSVKGEGSIFQVDLPRNLGRESGEGTASSKSNEEDSTDDEPAKAKAMVVEDNEFIRLLLERQLARVCEVETFEDAEAALVRASERTFDIIFLDIALPGIDGVEAMKALKEKGYNAQPIIAVTGHALPGDRERFLSAGFTHFISKPFTRSQLQKTVRSMLHL